MIKKAAIDIFGNAWPMIVIFTIILSSIRIAYLIIKKEKFVLYKELSYLLFAIYLLSLFYIVTFQDDNYGYSNLVPFKEIFRYNFGSKLFIKNIVGNVLLYMPFGLFVSAYLDNKKIFPIFILALISSVSIEFVQLAIGRVFDVDDIILNLVGGILGFLMYVGLDAIKSKIKILRNDTVLDILIILILIIVIMYSFNINVFSEIWG